jgi:hypothetical protein
VACCPMSLYKENFLLRAAELVTSHPNHLPASTESHCLRSLQWWLGVNPVFSPEFFLMASVEVFTAGYAPQNLNLIIRPYCRTEVFQFCRENHAAPYLVKTVVIFV